MKRILLFVFASFSVCAAQPWPCGHWVPQVPPQPQFTEHPIVFQLGPPRFALHPGDTRQLCAQFKGRRLKPSEVVWISGEPDVATVDGNGMVTAVSPGHAVIELRCQICGEPESDWISFSSVNVNQRLFP